MMTLQTAVPLEHRSLGATNRPADFFVRAVREGDMTRDARTDADLTAAASVAQGQA